MRKTITAVISLIVIAGAATGMYVWQNQKLAALSQQQSSLTQNIKTLQSQYAAAQATSTISTTSWKKYCDQFTPFCFSYPGSWTLTDSPLNVSGDQRDFATIVNPDKSIQINYANPLIKDGGSLSARIVKAGHITVNNTKVAVLGIIPVSSGTYQPSYIMLSNDQALNAAPGSDALLVSSSINPRFTVGKYDAILFDGSPTTKMTSYAQAQAWFDSIDGKTVAKILESYAGK